MHSGMLERPDDRVRGYMLSSAQMTDRKVLIMWRVLLPPLFLVDSFSASREPLLAIWEV